MNSDSQESTMNKLRAFIGEMQSVNRDFFSAITDKEKQKDFFFTHVRKVEVEVHSYCNRQCWFCPNSFIDRRSTRYMNEGTYLQLLHDLGEIDYQGEITFSRYNEPFADSVFFERVKQARDIVPSSILHTNTNGDFLSQEVVGKIYEAGLRSMSVQIYLNKNEAFNFTNIEKKADKLLERLDFILWKMVVKKKDHVEWLGYYKEMKVRCYARDFTMNGTDRAGLSVVSKPQERYSPCFLPFYSVHIDWNGCVMPCCNLRSDHREHEDAILGRLENNTGSIFQIFSNEKVSLWRKELLNFLLKKGVCRQCTFQAWPNEKRFHKILDMKSGLLVDTMEYSVNEE